MEMPLVSFASEGIFDDSAKFGTSREVGQSSFIAMKR